MTHPCAIVAPGLMSTGIPGRVQHAAVLHVRTLANDDGGEIGPQHGVEPDRRTRLHVHVPDQRGSRSDEGASADDGRSTLEGMQRHRLGTPQVVGLALRAEDKKL